MTADGRPFPPPAGGRRTIVERFLRLFTDVRGGEGPTALLLTSNVFLILTAYGFLRVVREPLIRASGGAEVASYSSVAQAAVLLGLVPAYALIAGRVPRRRLINVVTAFFVACLVAFYSLAAAGLKVGVVFWVWLGIFNVMVIAQFWAFANDVYTTEEGKRLFPLVAFGASSGAVLGTWLPGRLQSLVGVLPLLLISAGVLALAVLITNIVDERERRRTEARQPDPLTTGALPAATKQYRAESGVFKTADARYAKESGVQRPVGLTRPPQDEGQSPKSSPGAFALVFRSRYLLLIAMLMLFLNWANTNGEFILRNTVFGLAEKAGGAEGDQIVTSFYSNFYSSVNLLGMLIQLLLVSRIIKYFGVSNALLVLPVIAFIGYGLMAFVPILAAIKWSKTVENATDYSLQNTVRHALFLPTTREEKYAAKQAIDSFFQRAGDTMSAALVFVGTHWIVMRTVHYAIFNMMLVLVWLGLAVLIGRRYKGLAAATRA